MMATLTTGSMPTGPVHISTKNPAESRRRLLAPAAGQAIEILAHAIEYLADEYALGTMPVFARKGTIDAIQILMSLNREVYLSCPAVPSLRERLSKLRGWISALLSDGEDSEKQNPCQTHGVPVPRRCIHGNLPKLHALEQGHGGETYKEGSEANQKVQRVQSGNDVEEVTCGG